MYGPNRTCYIHVGNLINEILSRQVPLKHVLGLCMSSTVRPTMMQKITHMNAFKDIRVALDSTLAETPIFLKITLLNSYNYLRTLKTMYYIYSTPSS